MKYLMFLLLVLPLHMRAQQKCEHDTAGGWALHLGAGYWYGGNIGLAGQYEFRLNGKWRLSPFVSAGIAEGGKDTNNVKYLWYGSAAGIDIEYGNMHRIFFGPQLILNLVQNRNADVNQNSFAGGSFIAGYRGVAHCGLMWQVYVGDVYLPDPGNAALVYQHSSQLGLGIGYKFR